ncbi:MAG: TetR/AcrR family transcriptional regulator [Myxococcota bacterium]
MTEAHPAVANPQAAPAIEWVRPPVQDRSQRTLLRLLDATAVLLDERPFEAIGVTDIVKRANSSVGAFYARFSSKDAVLHSLHERYNDELRATADRALEPTAWDGVPFPEVTARFCEFVVQSHIQQAGLRRALLMASARDDVHRARDIELGTFVAGRIACLLERRRTDITHDDPALASDFIHRILFSILDQALIFDGTPAGRRLDPDQMSAQLNRTLLGYLGTQP